MFDIISSDDQMFDVLCSVIRKRIPTFKVRFKSESKWQRFIGKVAFFNRKYMTSYTSTFGTTVWFPSREFVDKDKWLAFKVLAHEYVHLLDRKEHKIFFELAYAFPQILGLFALSSFAACFFSNWWLLGMAALVFFLPLPAVARAVVEMRGYTMGLAINVWRHGSVLDSTKDGVVEKFTGWCYYKMWPFEDLVREWVDNAEVRIRNIDAIGEQADDTIFNDSESYSDVYSLMTGIED